MGFKGWFVGGLVIFVIAFAAVEATSPFGNSKLGDILFLYPVDILLGIILLGSLAFGILRNNDWNGLVAGAIVGMYLVAIFQAIGIIP